MSKDAEATRSLLVRAARRRFASDGYRATTVRDIASDAGVNVALISRYFGAKEGLFRACLERSVGDPPGDRPARTVEQVVDELVGHIVRWPTDDDATQLLLLLRSSGDEHVDEIRRRTLRQHASRLATAVGPAGDGPVDDDRLLRAEIALSVVLGMTMLRTSTRVEPLATAEDTAIERPLVDALLALLGGRG